MNQDAAPKGLRIAMVRIVKESLRTYRELNDDANPDLYPVMLWFNRHVDDFERKELASFGIVVSDDDSMNAIIWDTTLEQVRDETGRYNEVLASAVAAARSKREAAQAEDRRLEALVKEINEELRAERSGN